MGNMTLVDFGQLFAFDVCKNRDSMMEADMKGACFSLSPVIIE